MNCRDSNSTLVLPPLLSKCTDVVYSDSCTMYDEICIVVYCIVPKGMIPRSSAGPWSLEKRNWYVWYPAVEIRKCESRYSEIGQIMYPNRYRNTHNTVHRTTDESERKDNLHSAGAIKEN